MNELLHMLWNDELGAQVFKALNAYVRLQICLLKENQTNLRVSSVNVGQELGVSFSHHNLKEFSDNRSPEKRDINIGCKSVSEKKRAKVDKHWPHTRVGAF
jgi:hypothetical protein